MIFPARNPGDDPDHEEKKQVFRTHKVFSFEESFF